VIGHPRPKFEFLDADDGSKLTKRVFPLLWHRAILRKARQNIAVNHESRRKITAYAASDVT
jgi:hypothetical protein